MIEKKISYEINIEKPSKTKPVKQGGVLNYLGKQKTVSAPVKWRSSPKHPIAHLAYITKDEEKILVDLDLYGSLKGKPNKGPSGIMSLNGGGGGGDGGGGDGGGGDGGGSSGGDSGGDSGDSGDSGDAGDSGTGQSGAQSGDNTDGNNEGGTSGGPGTDGMGGPGGFGGEAAPGSEGGFGIGPGDETAAAQSVTADDVSAQAQADAEDAATAAAAAQAAQSQTGIIGTLGNIARTAMNAYANFSPTGLAIQGIMGLVDSVTKGKTGPDDFSQAQTSVQVGPSPTNDPGGGITTIPTYAPLTNVSTGDNTADSIRTRLENLLKVPPIAKIPTGEFTQVNNLQNISPLSNYTLLDLYNLRR